MRHPLTITLLIVLVLCNAPERLAEAEEEMPVITLESAELPARYGAQPVAEIKSKEEPEFPEAEQVWMELKKAGYSDAVCAGILGNIMAECSGCTFNLRPDVYDASGCYYGICQWNKWGYPQVQGKDLDFQIQFLLDTMESRFRSNYDNFVHSESPRDAALRFAIFYEGCAEFSYPVRQRNAEKALEYFGGKYCGMETENLS